MPGVSMPRAQEATQRRHTTRALAELDSIVRTAELLQRKLKTGQEVLQGDAQTLVTASVTVAERLAMLETLRDSAEWWTAELNG